MDEDDFEDIGLEYFAPTTDEFGVPSNILGAHPEEFFQMLGRIVALSSALEGNMRAFCEYLQGEPPGSLASVSLKELVKGGKKALPRLVDSDDRQRADDFLTRGEAAILKRHAYAHSLWPAQGDELMYGWKRSRKRTASRVDEISQTLDEMRSDLAEFISLCEVPYWHRMLGLVSSGLHLRGRDDTA